MKAHTLGIVVVLIVLVSLVYETNTKVSYTTEVPSDLVLLDLELEAIRESISTQTVNDNVTKRRLVQTLYHECRECSVEENLLILEVIANRWYTGYRNAKSIIEVIEQRKQFSYLNGVDSRELVATPTEPEDVKALEVLINLVEVKYPLIVNGEMTKGLLMYYNPDKVEVTPAWVDQDCIVDTGDTLHRFYTCYALK